MTLKKVPKNIKFKGFLSYRMIANTLPKYKILLMPYQKMLGCWLNELMLLVIFHLLSCLNIWQQVK